MKKEQDRFDYNYDDSFDDEYSMDTMAFEGDSTTSHCRRAALKIPVASHGSAVRQEVVKLERAMENAILEENEHGIIFSLEGYLSAIAKYSDRRQINSVDALWNNLNGFLLEYSDKIVERSRAFDFISNELPMPLSMMISALRCDEGLASQVAYNIQHFQHIEEDAEAAHAILSEVINLKIKSERHRFLDLRMFFTSLTPPLRLTYSSMAVLDHAMLNSKNLMDERARWLTQNEPEVTALIRASGYIFDTTHVLFLADCGLHDLAYEVLCRVGQSPAPFDFVRQCHAYRHTPDRSQILHITKLDNETAMLYLIACGHDDPHALKFISTAMGNRFSKYLIAALIDRPRVTQDPDSIAYSIELLNEFVPDYSQIESACTGRGFNANDFEGIRAMLPPALRACNAVRRKRVSNDLEY